MTTKYVVGIDLGTTYSAIAYINRHGKSEILRNREGDAITPSVVLFDGETRIVGIEAKNSAKDQPDNVCLLVKREMGNKDYRFRPVDGQEYTAEEISATILRRLKDDAELDLQQIDPDSRVVDAVITVPAYFDDAQRKATQDAGIGAGLNVLRIINEPTAAALAYGINATEEQTVMVYDLGGGTFDVTIMRISNGKFDVIATGGDRLLGGSNWDERLMLFLSEEFRKASGFDLPDDAGSKAGLRDKAETNKKKLTQADNIKVSLSAAGKNATIRLTREDFERETQDLLDLTENYMELTLRDAQLVWGDIDKVLLVGGSTRMPAVPAMVERVSGKKPLTPLNPDEAVALGAALQGGILQRETGTGDRARLEQLPSVQINDVNSHSLGVKVKGESGGLYNSIILPKNTKVRTPMKKQYYTMVDNQTTLSIEVNQGEEEDLKYVTKIGEAVIGIPPYPSGAPVEVTFEYNEDGLIHATVFDVTAKKQLGELKIERKANLSDAEIGQMQHRTSLSDIQ